MIYLVGAGPGSLDLLTVRARDLLARADIIIHDALVSNEIVSGGRSDARRIRVGKRERTGPSHKRGARTVTANSLADRSTLSTQQQINELLLELAPTADVIVRLKGGDPFVFGRGGEEALALAEKNIPFEVVPGVTSAIAAPAYAGIPVTHRGLAEAVTFITGHREESESEPNPDYGALVKLQGTIVFLMGAGRISEIVEALVAHGKDSRTPAAIIQWGTLAHQRSVRGTLATIAKLATDDDIASPAIFVIGAVASLSDQLNWFESQPLFGKRIVITQSHPEKSRVSGMLRSHGALVIEAPLMSLRALKHEPLDEALTSVKKWTDLIVTSSFAAEIIAGRMTALGIDGRAFSGLKISAIGASTARTLERTAGLRADLIPVTSTSEGLLDSLGNRAGRRFLWPCAKNRRPTMKQDLGENLTELPIYETEPAEAAEIRGRFDLADIDAIVFSSRSQVDHFLKIFSDQISEFSRLAAIAIGPVTAAALEQAGVHPLLADSPAAEDVSAACMKAFG